MLGLGVALAISNSIFNAVVMSICYFLIIISWKYILQKTRAFIRPENYYISRVIFFAIIVTTIIIITDTLFISMQILKIYLPLLVFECLFQKEPEAENNSFKGLLVTSIGDARPLISMLLFLAFIRELAGKILGLNIMMLPPGAFFAYALILVVYRIKENREALKLRLESVARVQGKRR